MKEVESKALLKRKVYNDVVSTFGDKYRYVTNENNVYIRTKSWFDSKTLVTFNIFRRDIYAYIKPDSQMYSDIRVIGKRYDFNNLYRHY